MSMIRWRRAWLAAALVTTVGAGLDHVPARAVQAAGRTAALGPCWLSQLGFGLGEDTNAVDYVTAWRGGGIQTVLQGQMPHARYWSITLYHAAHGKMVTYYDAQISAQARGGSYTIAIGSARPAGKAIWINPTAGGGDSQGYVFLRIYELSGGKAPLPSVTYTAISGALPASLSSCSSMSSALRNTLDQAAKARPASGKAVGESAKNKLWIKGQSPYKIWSKAVNPLLSVPDDATKVPLLTQLADPNVTYHAVFFNLSWGDMVLHGTLPKISAQAPRSGVRYLSMCAYPNDESHKPLACLNDQTIKADSHGHYIVVVSPDQPDDASNAWLNPGDNVSVGSIVLRWVLPQQGPNANLCIPSILYRQPGDTTVPPLPSGC